MQMLNTKDPENVSVITCMQVDTINRDYAQLDNILSLGKWCQ